MPAIKLEEMGFQEIYSSCYLFQRKLKVQWCLIMNNKVGATIMMYRWFSLSRNEKINRKLFSG